MDDGKAFWLAAAERYIEDCCRNGSTVRVSEFASLMERTAVQLAREFQASAGIGVKVYFSRRQIACAKELLRTTGQSTAQIGHRFRVRHGPLVLSCLQAFRRAVAYGVQERNVTWRA
jgi:methylphosphotriester-DNA--protein-cysteine methyltransferase